MWNLKKDITVNVCSSSFQWYNTHCILMTFNFFVTYLLSLNREVKCGHVTRWTNLLMTTCCDTFRYLNYSLYNFEIKLPKREQQMLNACFEPVVIVFCCVIIRTTSNVCEVFVDTRPSPPRPRISDSGRLNSVV